MDIREYQKAAMRTCPSNLPRDEALLNAALGLAGEAGEFADIVKKVRYQGLALDAATQARLAEELGDLLWYTAQACDALGLTIAFVMMANILKLQSRYPNGFVSRFSQQEQEAPTTTTTTVRQIVVEYLKEHGFDGLQDSQCECGCETNDLMPCYGLLDNSNNVPGCEAGYRTACDCGDHDWHMSSPKEE